MMTRILIADDHPVVLEGLAALFQGTDYSVVARCTTGDEVMEVLRTDAPDILLLDVNMPPPGGLDIARTLHEEGRRPRIVLLTASIESSQALNAIRLGVSGLVLKESAPRQLLQCLAAVRGGDQWLDPQVAHLAVTHAQRPNSIGADVSLTARELQVTRLVVRGLRNKEIGQELHITEGTVKMYLHTLYDKLGVKSRMELANVAREKGIV